MRRRKGGGRGPDFLFGYLIPAFFLALAGYQQVTDGAVDKYVLGALVLFGLGALGYRVDLIIEKYFAMKTGQGQGNREDDK